jgi:hypothetical protein
VGGGYRPGALGISVGNGVREGDTLKLAQIPLNHMLECARAAGAPMDKEDASTIHNAAPFAIDPRLQKARDDFLVSSTLKSRALHEWLQPYLNWRWEVRARFTSLNHVRNANRTDAALLIKYNDYLLADAALLDAPENRSVLSRFSPLQNAMQLTRTVSRSMLDAEAPTVLAIAKAAAPTAAAMHHLFDHFVHDSLAGFNHHALEPTGHWRYRKGFLGSRKRLIAENDDDADLDRVATTG